MNKQQQEMAIRIAREVHAGQLRATEGARRLSETTHIAIGSAKIAIEVYLRMCEGRVFQRHLSKVDMEYFVGTFAASGEPAKLASALEALRLHIAYREATGVGQRANRVILAENEARLLARQTEIEVVPISLQDLNARFAEEVDRSRQDSVSSRQNRLTKARKLPQKVPRLVYVYERNPDVVAEVLFIANGECQDCRSPAPFLRNRDSTPYLEVHHRLPLADGGEDTVENAIALCPNCHRRRHYG